MPKNPNQPNQNQDTEFAEDQTPVTDVPENQNFEEQKKAQDFENKDARGGNHNPEGANQYTSGRVDDRGRKEDDNQRENKGRK